MANIIRRPPWHIADHLITPETAFTNRRQFLKQMGFAGAGVLAASLAAQAADDGDTTLLDKPRPGLQTLIDKARPKRATYPARRNPEFDPKWPLTNEKVAGSYNNFYEFSLGKENIAALARNFVTAPWPVEITGLVEKPMTVDAQELAATMGLEERVYRFRCVEAWAMIVPWTGFSLSKLIEMVAPKPEAKFIRFETFNRPQQAPGIALRPQYPWPYSEGLRMDEAMHPLTMVATGIYGKPLPKQHGAPIRIVVPWKYGYKSIKSIVKIEFIAQQPATYWETLQADEYPFESNVNPAAPHPRWSQATERMIDTDDRVKTRPYNGYGTQVARLYKKA